VERRVNAWGENGMNSFALRKWLLWAENAATGFVAKAQVRHKIGNKFE
jgi:hypothetical protein